MREAELCMLVRVTHVCGTRTRTIPILDGTEANAGVKWARVRGEYVIGDSASSFDGAADYDDKQCRSAMGVSYRPLGALGSTTMVSSCLQRCPVWSLAELRSEGMLDARASVEIRLISKKDA